MAGIPIQTSLLSVPISTMTTHIENALYTTALGGIPFGMEARYISLCTHSIILLVKFLTLSNQHSWIRSRDASDL